MVVPSVAPAAMPAGRIIPWGEHRRTLGHPKADMTQIHAERDMNRAANAAQNIGRHGTSVTSGCHVSVL